MNRKEISVDLKINKVSTIAIVNNIKEAFDCINHAKLEINGRQLILRGVITETGAIFSSDDRNFTFEIIKDGSKIIIKNHYEEEIHIKKIVFLKKN